MPLPVPWLLLLLAAGCHHYHRHDNHHTIQSMPLCSLLDRSSVPNLPFAARVPTVFCSVGAGPALGHDLSRGIPVPQYRSPQPAPLCGYRSTPVELVPTSRPLSTPGPRPAAPWLYLAYLDLSYTGWGRGCMILRTVVCRWGGGTSTCLLFFSLTTENKTFPRPASFFSFYLSRLHQPPPIFP